MNCTVLGSGTWGSSLAQVLSDNKHNVMIYGIDKGEVDDINLNHKNAKYFGDEVILNSDIKATMDMALALENAEVIVVPEFKDCASYGGVGYAIEVAGMGAGLEAYDKAANGNVFGYGDVLITESGKPGVKLAHVATAGAKADTQFGVILRAMYQVLVLANASGIKSIAVPEIGTGIIGTLTPEQSAKAIFAAIAKFTERFPENLIQKVTLVIYRGSTSPAETVLSNHSYNDIKSITDVKGEKDFNMVEWLQGMGFLG